MPRIACFALIVCLSGSTAMAQGDAMSELYGEGVHRFFCGDLSGADQVLSRVVDSGSLDPRAHYFRGLVRQRQGGGGQFDFENGARLEAEGKRVVNVGFALSRIQGSVRGQIERARRDARVMVRQQQLMMEQARRDAGPSMAAPQSPIEPLPALPSETGSTDPFSGEGMRSDDATVDPLQPANPEVDANTNPFADEPAPAGTPDAPSSTEPDPFGPSTTEPGAPDPFGAPAADGVPDPFGTPGPDSGTNPFGT